MNLGKDKKSIVVECFLLNELNNLSNCYIEKIMIKELAHNPIFLAGKSEVTQNKIGRLSRTCLKR